MTATLPVLPGEDAEAPHGRIDAWTVELRPRNEIEKYLAERAAQVSWQLDRVERAHVARLSANINNAATGVRQPEEDDILMLGWRLFWDARGPLPLNPHFPCQPARPSKTSFCETKSHWSKQKRFSLFLSLTLPDTSQLDLSTFSSGPADR